VAPGVPKGTPAVITRRGAAPAGEIGFAGKTDGALDHVGEIVRVLGLHRMDAPGERHAPRGVEVGREAEDAHVGSLACRAQGGRAGVGVGDNGRGRERVRALSRGGADGVGGGRFGLTAARIHQAAIERVALHALDDAVHDGDGLDRVLARGRFGREHDGIGTVVDRGRHVRCLGPRRCRRMDHRIEHLRRHDGRPSCHAAGGEDALLQRRHRLGRHLHAEVAARHHDAVALLDDLVEVIDGLRLLQLGHDGGASGY
jgi:hypothetical protein